MVVTGCIQNEIKPTPVTSPEPEQMKSCDDCVNGLKSDSQDIWGVCNYCFLRLGLKSESDNQKEIDRIKKLLSSKLHQKFVLLGTDRDSVSVLRNIVNILKCHEEIYKKFPPENKTEKEELRNLRDVREEYEIKLSIAEQQL